MPWLDERCRSLRAESGYHIGAVGAKSNGDVVCYYKWLGCEAEPVRDRWRWVARIPVGRAIAYLAARAYSFTAAVPDTVHDAAVRVLERQAAALPGGLDAVAEVPNQVQVVLVSRNGG